MTDLLARLKKAECGSRELDALTEVEKRRFDAYAVGLNDDNRAYWKSSANGGVYDSGAAYEAPHYTTCVTSALTLVPDGLRTGIVITENGKG